MASWLSCASFDPSLLETEADAPSQNANRAQGLSDPPPLPPEEPPLPPDFPAPEPPPPPVDDFHPVFAASAVRSRDEHGRARPPHKRDHKERKRKEPHKKHGKRAKEAKEAKKAKRKKRRRAEEERREPSEEAGRAATAVEKRRMLDVDQRYVKSDPRAAQPAGWQSAAEAFAFDVRGDRDNLAFGRQFHAHVPRYRPLNRVDDEGAREGVRYWKASGGVGEARRLVSAATLRRRYQRRRGAEEAAEDGGDFVAVGDGWLDPAPAAATSGWGSDEVSEASSGDEQQGGGGAKLLGGGAFERLRALNEAVRRAPADVAAWKALAEFSGAAADGGRGGRKQGAVTERKLTVLRRAVEANPDSVALRSMLLQACDGFLPPEQREHEWEVALAAFPGSIALWSLRLSRFSRTFASFCVSELRALGQKAIFALQRQQQLAVASGAADDEVEALERSSLLLALRVAYSERAAGFTERGVALLQALIEFNCFCPPPLQAASLERRCAAFEPFWESEVPRVGQPGARGWEAWRPEQTAEDFAPEAFGAAPLHPEELDAMASLEGAAPPDEPSPTRRACDAWARREARAARAGFLPVPAAIYPDVADTDPERVPFFDDLRPFLVVLRRPAALRELALEAACFLSIPGAGAHVPSSHPLAAMRAGYAEWPEQLLPSPAPHLRGGGSGEAAAAAGAAEGEEMAQFGAQLMLQLSRVYARDEEIVYLSMRAAGADGVRKTAKALLKLQPAHLPLWRSYARAEEHLGRPAEAAKVYDSALRLCAPPAGKAAVSELLPLAYAAAKLQLRLEQEDAAAGVAARHGAEAAALRLLARVWSPELADGAASAPPRTLVLRARVACLETLTAALAAGGARELDDSLLYTTLAAALISFLSVGVDAAVEAFELTLAAVGDVEGVQRGGLHANGVPQRGPPQLRGAGSRAHEILSEEYIWLLRRHSSTHPMPPGRLRSVIERGLFYFPANSCILTAFAESRSSTQSRLYRRRLMQDCCRRVPECPQLWLCAVRLELHSARTATFEGCSVAPEAGAERRARGVLEKALLPSACGGCAALWQEYLHLELRARRFEAASRLVLRSEQQCPGFKSIWCAALQPPLLQSIPVQQLHDTLQLMAEKELRMRHEPPVLPDPKLELSAGNPTLPADQQPSAARDRLRPYSSFRGRETAAAPPSRMPAGEGVAFSLAGRRPELAPNYGDATEKKDTNDTRSEESSNSDDDSGSDSHSSSSGSSVDDAKEE
ncbi:hypothetical protein AB1Y20_009522 [Prymnesium parvum]|uniref:Uncharacterized protein n=1 Tax=Prymnesium parvum TaxID=97485 RepID=A0AB34K506_PRYPA